MTFDYFNVSNLAWGKKITQAFKTLNSMQDETDDHFLDIVKVLDYYSQYIPNFVIHKHKFTLSLQYFQLIRKY